MAHGGLLTALATFTIPGLPQAFDFTLSLSNEPVLADEAAIDDFAVDPLEMLDSIDGLVLPEVAPVSAELAGLDESSLLTDAAHFATAIALDSAADLLASADANAGTSLPSGEDLTASFFGTKVEGRRILYVLDNSGGMRKGGLEVLIDELVRSVDTLTPQQKFYVIFYSDSVYPLFHPSPANEFVPANDRIKARLQKWLEKVELSVGNSVDEAIQMAAEIQPDAVYLLTDGNVNTTDDGRKLAALLDRRDREFPIHTFLIGMGPNSKAAENLRLVAQANNGTFRAVEVTPEASARAKQKNRPYHNKEPGKVWGRNVGRGWGR